MIPVSLDHVDHFSSIRTTHRRLRSDHEILVPLTPERFSRSKHLQASSSTFYIPPPQGLHPKVEAQQNSNTDSEFQLYTKDYHYMNSAMTSSFYGVGELEDLCKQVEVGTAPDF